MQVKKLPIEELNRLRIWVHDNQHLIGEFSHLDIRNFVSEFTGIDIDVEWYRNDNRIVLFTPTIYPEILGMILAFIPKDTRLEITEIVQKGIIIQ